MKMLGLNVIYVILVIFLLSICASIVIALTMSLSFINKLFVPFDSTPNPLYNLSKGNVKQKKTYLTFIMKGKMFKVKMYYLESGFSKLNNENVVCIHGMAASAKGYIPLFKSQNDKRIIAIDLPGFGRSTSTNTHILQTAHDFLEFYNACIYHFLNKKRIKKTVLVGHSFGAYLSIYFSNCHSKRITRVVLSSSPGIFPTLGEWGGYWAVLFKSGFPYTICKLFGLGNALSVFRLLGVNEDILHDLKLYTNKGIFANRVISSYITLTSDKIVWNKPLLKELLQTKVKTTIVYGEGDNLTPCHIGETISDIKKDIYFIRTPHHHLLDDNIDIITEAINNTNVTHKKSKSQVNCEYTSSLCKNHNKKVLDKLYNFLKETIK